MWNTSSANKASVRKYQYAFVQRLQNILCVIVIVNSLIKSWSDFSQHISYLQTVTTSVIF